MTKKEEEEENNYQNYWTFIYEVRNLPMLQCPHFMRSKKRCSFKTVYKKSLEHHLKYTHRTFHPSPPNEQWPKMNVKDILDWQDAEAGKKGRRSGLKIL